MAADEKDSPLSRFTFRPEPMISTTNFVIFVIGTALGFGAGWLWLGSRLKKVQQAFPVASPQPPEKRPEVRDLVQQILAVAGRLEGNVGRHSHQLNEVNAEIEQVLGNQPSPVVEMTRKLVESNVQLRLDLQTARQEITTKQQELENHISEARTDILTGLKNRRSFLEELDRLFAQHQRQGTALSLLMIDVDQFKRLNDVYGHLAGDLVLRSVAQVLSHTLRDMDIACRYGGEEFSVICPGSQLREAAVAGERVCAAIAAESVTLKEGLVQVTVSVGVAELVDPEVIPELVQHADEALYSAKNSGRNRVYLHDGKTCVPAKQMQATLATQPPSVVEVVSLESSSGDRDSAG